MGGLTNKQIEERMKLEEYGVWVRQSGVSLNYSLQPSVIRKGGRTPDIRDEEAKLVDRALGEIKVNHDRDYKVLWKAYIIGLDDREVAEDLRLSANRAIELRTGALKAWFYCWRGQLQDAEETQYDVE